MKGIRKRLTTTQQFLTLLHEMRTKPSLAGGPVFGANKSTIEQEWERIREELNALGPPVRSTPEWKKVWSDMKVRAKKKLAAERGSGRGPFSEANLTTFEKETVDIMGYSSVAMSDGLDFGLTNKASADPLSVCNPPSIPDLPDSPEADDFEIDQQTIVDTELEFPLENVTAHTTASILPTAEEGPVPVPSRAAASAQSFSRPKISRRRLDDCMSLLREKNATQLQMVAALQERNRILETAMQEQSNALKANTMALHEISATILKAFNVKRQRKD